MSIPARLLCAVSTIALIVGVLAVGPADALSVETELTSSSPGAGAEYGQSVAVDGDTIVVGEHRADAANGRDVGAAFVYTPDGAGGLTETRLSASDAAGLSQFGWRVALSGGTVVVGAPAVGAVYVYSLNEGGGYDETILFEPAPFFGFDVDIDGDTIVVGTFAGSAYAFTPDGLGGYASTEITASDEPAGGQAFGTSVAVSGTTIVVGAREADGGGAAYVYTPDEVGGLVETKLTASTTSGLFGNQVAIDGDLIAISDNGDDEAGDNAGAVYVFTPDEVSGFTEAKLTASDGEAFDRLGTALDVSGATIIAGAFRDDDGGSSSGSAYVFTPDGDGEYSETKLTASDAAANDFFGRAVGIDGETAIVGAPGVDGAIIPGAETAENTGSAYLFTAPPAALCNGLTVTVDLNNGDVPTAGDDVILGTSGDDDIDALEGNDVVCAGDGNDTVLGGAGDDTIFGEGGNDTLTGADDNDIVDGGPGDDSLAGNAGNDQLDGQDGVDRAFGGSGDDVVNGDAGNDVLGGGSGVDVVSGGADDDAISGGSGDDGMISGDEGNDAVNGGGGDDAMVFGNDGDDTVSGNGGQDVVDGGAGNDEVRGGNNNDTVNGGPGDDFVAGNDGVDVCDGGIGDEVAGDVAAGNCETVLNVP